MITIEQEITNLTLQYPLEKIAPLDKLLFLDIETTGFTAKTSTLYLIGCSFYRAGHWYCKQWFAKTYEMEKDILIAFFEFIKDFSHLIHFNGNNFDLPFLLQKCQQYQLSYNFDDFQGIDLYRRVAPYKYFLHLPNCKQKTLEHFLGINRTDTFQGGELISVYHDYVKEPTEFGQNLLLLHNADDVKGMLEILPILAYYDLFTESITAKKVQANYYTDCHGIRRQELVMSVTLPTSLPVSVSANYNGCFFSGAGDTGCIKVPFYEEELKYFYANYKDYYYLPSEDLALHKSVASFVDKEHRTQATAATCYTRKFSSYLPQWEMVVEPFFKRDYKSKDLFFEVTDEMKQDRELFSRYATHILEVIATY